MTYDNTVLEAETSTALTSLEEDLEELEKIIFEEIFETVEFKEEIELSFSIVEEPLEEEFEEISFTPILTILKESVMEEEEIIMEETKMEEPKTFVTSLLPPVTTEEEIYEETEEIITSFLPMVSKEEEPPMEEEETVSTGPIQMESTEEEPKTLIVQKKETINNEKETKEEKKKPEVKEEKKAIKEEKEEVTKKTTEVVEATHEEETKEEESTSETSATSVVSSKENSEQKDIQSKKALVANIGKVMDKVDKEVKDISKNLEIKNIIKLGAMASEQVSLGTYSNVEFYKPKDIYLNQVIIADPRKIYKNITLVQYTDNDIIKAKKDRLYNIKLKKEELIRKLETLKNG
jgi:chemotaxis protein histidine kinase CheA